MGAPRLHCDHVAVERMIQGQFRGVASSLEVDEVIRRLTPKGYSDGQIAYLTNRKSRRGILRRRMDLGIESRCFGANAGVPGIPTIPHTQW